MKYRLFFFLSFVVLFAKAQTPVSLPENLDVNTTKVALNDDLLALSWNIADTYGYEMILDLKDENPLFKAINVLREGDAQSIIKNANPEFILNVGKRELKPENGWTVFFDKVPTRPYESHLLTLEKKSVKVTKTASSTVVSIGEIKAPDFTGNLEITIYSNTHLFNIAAVVETEKDATAILYDAGLTVDEPFKNVAFAKTTDEFQTVTTTDAPSINEKVKYRTIIGTQDHGSIAVFPAPHQYFYPLDEAFNLAFVWHGNNYRDMISKNGIGIRQEPKGDERFVPWFNAPPNTKQRLNFFCELWGGNEKQLLDNVKRYTHGDTYPEIEGYKTMASHFHNEYIMNVVRKDKPVPDMPEFVNVLKSMGVDIVHLGEFHYTAHPKGPDELRLEELKALFDLCDQVSDEEFLLLPGEEPNEFLGGHWMQLFANPVYWIMSRDDDKPFVTNDPKYGKVYRIKDKNEMLDLLKKENGLAWTAHPRIKGSTGYPDKYKDEEFFKADEFLGGAWKAMPADLSRPELGWRVLDLLDDMNNWGLKKHVIAESDLFTITPENEMYAHMNMNYLKIDKIPDFSKGWKPVVNAMQKGQFFSTTGEIMIPKFKINGKEAGETVSFKEDDTIEIELDVNYTFPLHYVQIVTGDGEKTYTKNFEAISSRAFGSEQLKFSTTLNGKKWIRLEVWDIAANGAFTQTIYLDEKPLKD